ncbi:MAG: N-glycosylase [Thermoplasmata archaeon M9B1D]|nr:MAG: N-glycosylase [Thermoplasmata archaeon M8B2D]PNX47727.1 MAG: N-glycosylase [Thermoplasmata archaeon M9B1D]
MNDLIAKIEQLKKTNIKQKVNQRIKQFKNINKKSNDELFKEMCFCMLTANFNAEKSIKIQNEIGQCFITDSKEQLCNKLREYGHRFPNTRAYYIHQSQKCKNDLSRIVNFHDKKAVREWIVKNVKGLGYKEASHFLRNIGFDDYAIIDFHIIDILSSYHIINKPKTITKNKYLEIEEKLIDLAKKTNLTLAELDLYLWYMETGKILK